MGVLGYNQPRPKREDYNRFIELFVKGLSDFGSRLTFMTYGSFVRGDFVPGRSDIDALLIFHEDVVIDKAFYAEISDILASILNKHFIPFQATPCDIATLRDGRFNTYDPHFKKTFQEEGKVLLGRDAREEIGYEFPSKYEQGPLSFNLRKSRAYLLFSAYDRNTDPALFVSRFMKTLGMASRASTHVFNMNSHYVPPNRFGGLENLAEAYPDLDLETLKYVKRLFDNPNELDGLFHKPDEMLKIWNQTVTFFESLVRAYIREHPKK
ncbi:Uncharacterised protein [uncultured archaeon]|nr:Uncharacterised protein [uncultured archaeon]